MGFETEIRGIPEKYKKEVTLNLPINNPFVFS
jgi:hypothetical protein